MRSVAISHFSSFLINLQQACGSYSMRIDDPLCYGYGLCMWSCDLCCVRCVLFLNHIALSWNLLRLMEWTVVSLNLTCPFRTRPLEPIETNSRVTFMTLPVRWRSSQSPSPCVLKEQTRIVSKIRAPWNRAKKTDPNVHIFPTCIWENVETLHPP